MCPSEVTVPASESDAADHSGHADSVPASGSDSTQPNIALPLTPIKRPTTNTRPPGKDGR